MEGGETVVGLFCVRIIFCIKKKKGRLKCSQTQLQEGLFCFGESLDM